MTWNELYALLTDDDFATYFSPKQFDHATNQIISVVF